MDSYRAYSYQSGPQQLRFWRMRSRIHVNPPRRAINAVASTWEEIAQAMAGANAIVPIIYGRLRVAPVIGTYGEIDTPELAVMCVWGLGELQQIHGIFDRNGNGLALVTHETYLGTTSQGISPLLQSALPGWDKALVLDLFGRQYGVGYSVIGLSPSEESAGLVTSILGDISGRKVYDPRSDTTAWSDNPALCLADFLADPVVGGGFAIDWASVEMAAEACDEVVGAGKRRTLNLAITKQGSLEDWISTLRTYAGCHLDFSGNAVKFIPDRPSSPTRTLTDADIRRGSFSPSLRGRKDTPTVQIVSYTNGTSGTAEAVAYAAGVLDGDVEWRESKIELPGINTHAEAYRAAVERLNAFHLCDLDVEFTTFDAGLQDEVGDVITLNTSHLGAAVDVRILSVTAEEPGRWRVQAEEYDAAVYSDAVVADPGFGTGTLSNPADPPAITGLSLAEEVYQLLNGTWSSRVRATWTAPSWPFLAGYDVQVLNGSTLVAELFVRSSEAVAGPLQEGIVYRVLVRSRSSIGGLVGAWTESQITPAGKYLPPGDVASLTGLEVGGEVRLSWTEASDIDVWRYEVRYGATTDAWEAATFVDRVDALRCITREIPEGTWRFFVKAIDSVGLESENAATVDLDVTQDRNILSDRVIFESPTLTNVVGFHLGRLDAKTIRYATDAGTVAASIFTANPLGSTYPNAMQSYHGAASSSVVTEVHDYGNVINGQFLAVTDATAISGEIIETLQLSTDGGSYSDNGLSVKTLARYAKIKIETDSSADTLMCAVPDIELSLVSVTREESGSGTSSALVATTIECLSTYASIAQIIITPIGSTALVGVPDNITSGDPTTFDVYIFNAAGAQVANAFLWTLKGI